MGLAESTLFSPKSSPRRSSSSSSSSSFSPTKAHDVAPPNLSPKPMLRLSARSVSLRDMHIPDDSLNDRPSPSLTNPAMPKSPLPKASKSEDGVTDKARQRPHFALANSKTRSHTSPALYRTQSAFEIGRTPSIRKTTAYSTTVTAAAQAKVEGRENVDVFLGGSCNPTTWRRDTAMPMLDAAGVSYYNPQVDDWYEELVYEESVAKESAVVLLVVIDNATRGIVSIHECIEHIFRGRRMVLVVQSFEEGASVDGKLLTRDEIADLNGARACLRRLAIKKNVPLFDGVQDAVRKVIRVLARDKLKAATHTVPRLRKLSSIVLNEWAGQFHLKSKVLRSCSSSSILSVVSDNGDATEDAAHPNAILVNEGVTGSKGGFVFLGGTLGHSKTHPNSWRERVAIPKLQQAGIPFYIPLTDYLSFELKQLTSPGPRPATDEREEVETQRDLAQLVLFVIPNRSRAISAMTEAVELIANHYALLLVIEPLADGCQLDDGTTLSGREFKDLARSRVYLEEMAIRHAVEVFESVEMAINSLIARLHIQS